MTSTDPHVTVRFFSTAKRLFGAGQIAVAPEPGAATNVESLLVSVCDTVAKCDGVFATPGVLRADITVLLNGRNIALRDGLRTSVQPGDVVAVVPPMAGG